MPVLLSCLVSCYLLQNVCEEAAEETAEADQKLVIATQSPTDLLGSQLHYVQRSNCTVGPDHKPLQGSEENKGVEVLYVDESSHRNSKEVQSQQTVPK